jgi:type IV pilus assembly protein PilW
MLISLTIGLIIVAVLSSTFLYQQSAYDAEEQVAEAVQTLRAAVDMMTREIRMAGYNPTEASFNGIPYSSTQLQLLSDLNGDGDTADAEENIIYKYFSATKQIKRKEGSGDFEPFAENIDSLTITYLDSADNATTTSANIRQIQLAITAITAEAVAGHGYQTVRMDNRVMVRNLAYGQ